MKIEGITISNPGKIIFPDKGLTKGDVVSYYDRIAGYMLPYLLNRPVTLQRFPDGIDKPGFYQKHAQDYFPDYIERIDVKTKDGRAEEILINNKESLIYLANQSAVTFHTWLSSKGSLEFPDKVIFDLDPSDRDFSKLKKGARLIRKALEKEGMQPGLMTTGKNGLHIFYSIRPNKGFDEVRSEARELAESLVEAHPNLFTLEIRKKKRGNRIFIDTLRNSYAQSGVCPYSIRPINSAGVATPLEWKELGKISAGDHYTFNNIFRRLGARS